MRQMQFSVDREATVTSVGDVFDVHEYPTTPEVRHYPIDPPVRVRPGVDYVLTVTDDGTATLEEVA